jgi:hypothetical protein
MTRQLVVIRPFSQVRLTSDVPGWRTGDDGEPSVTVPAGTIGYVTPEDEEFPVPGAQIEVSIGAQVRREDTPGQQCWVYPLLSQIELEMHP